MDKDKIKALITSDRQDFKRFEMIEHFIEYVSDESDIVFLLDILKSDSSSIVRHEAAAQLLKIEQRKPWLLDPLREKVIQDLLHVVLHDSSLVAKHESVEALSYIGDESVLPIFSMLLSKVDSKSELLDSVQIAQDAIKYRITKNIKPGDLCKSIMSEN